MEQHRTDRRPQPAGDRAAGVAARGEAALPAHRRGRGGRAAQARRAIRDVLHGRDRAPAGRDRRAVLDPRPGGGARLRRSGCSASPTRRATS